MFQTDMEARGWPGRGELPQYAASLRSDRVLQSGQARLRHSSRQRMLQSCTAPLFQSAMSCVPTENREEPVEWEARQVTEVC